MSEVLQMALQGMVGIAILHTMITSLNFKNSKPLYDQSVNLASRSALVLCLVFTHYIMFQV